MSAAETPFFFESRGFPLYAVHHAPAGPPRGTVVVHAHGLAVEQITAYRAEVLAARALAAAGHAVLRFHARGHGDSTGDFADVTLDTLAEDTAAAADEARRRSGAARVLGLGVRFGALVAARAFARRPDLAGLVLWEPVHDGREYFRAQMRSMLFSMVAAGVRPDRTADQLLEDVEAGGSTDVQGYLLHREMMRSAVAARLADELGGWAGPTLIAQIQGRASLSAPNERLRDALAARGASIRTFVHREDPGWHYIQNPAWECPPLVQATREFADAVA